MRVLQQLLDMEVVTPAEQKHKRVRMLPGGMILPESELSIPAQALIQTGTPHTIVHLDNMMEVLTRDPEAFFELTTRSQRKNFVERDLDVPLDVSPFVFVASIDHPDIMDYLEARENGRLTNFKDAAVIDLTEDIDIKTKIRVARDYIRPKLEKKWNVTIPDAVVDKICKEYAIWGRHDIAAQFMEQVAQKASASFKKEVTLDDLEKLYLGPAITTHTNNPLSDDTVGSINGLAAMGGGAGSIFEIALKKEADWAYNPETQTHGRVKVNIYGPTGEMAIDSSQKVKSHISSTLESLEGKYEALKYYKDRGVTLGVWFPTNADGPSAGMAMAAAAVSALTNIPIRQDVAITGEILPGGKIGRIGGIFNKVTAAYNAGMKTIMMPYYDLKVLENEHPIFTSAIEKEGINLIGVKNLDEVLQHALTDPAKLNEALPPPPEKENPVKSWMNRLESLLETIQRLLQAIIDWFARLFGAKKGQAAPESAGET